MRGAPMTIWTCDKCGIQTTVHANSHPPSWRIITARYVGSKDIGDYVGEWCGPCSAGLKTKVVQ